MAIVKKTKAKAKAKSKPKPKLAPTPKKEEKAEEEFRHVIMTDEEAELQEIVIVEGEIGSGKTFMALTASDFAPKQFPAKRMTVLEDLLIGATDVKGTAGMKSNNVKCPMFDFRRYIKNAPDATIIDARDAFLNAADDFVEECDKKGLRPKICMDTGSGFDDMLIKYHEELFANDGNHYAPYQANLREHRVTTIEMMETYADIIYNMHTKALVDSNIGGQDKAVATRVACEARYGPDITGQGGKYYTRHATLLLNMKAYKAKVRGRLITERKVLVGLNDENCQGKNRYEALLKDPVMEPDLGAIFRIIRGGK